IDRRIRRVVVVDHDRAFEPAEVAAHRREHHVLDGKSDLRVRCVDRVGGRAGLGAGSAHRVCSFSVLIRNLLVTYPVTYTSSATISQLLTIVKELTMS